MATSISATWANLDSCHEIVAGPELRARLAQAPQWAGPELASPAPAGPGHLGTTQPGNGQDGTVVMLRPAGAHAGPESAAGTGESRPGRPSLGRHRRNPQVAASA